MPLWRNIRRLDTSGPVQGVVNPGPTDVVTPLQAVQIVDDASHAVAPVPSTEGFVGDTGVPAGAEHSGLELNPKAGGLWLRFAYGQSAGAPTPLFWRDDAQVVVSRIAAVRQSNTNSFPFVSGLFDVQIAAAALPASRLLLIISLAIPIELDLFLPSGERWFVVNNAPNAAMNVGLRISEVPLATRNA